MDAKPVSVTSPGNAWAIAMQVFAFVVPFLSVTERYQPVALESVSPLLADLWQWVLLVSAVIAFLASLAAQMFGKSKGALLASLVRVEGVVTFVMSVCFAALWVALSREYGYGSNPLTQAAIAMLSLGALGRVGQIVWDLVKYRRALRGGQTAVVEALAQPKES